MTNLPVQPARFFCSRGAPAQVGEPQCAKSLTLYCDLDNLKKINDSYGTWREICIDSHCGRLGTCFRDSDILARIGGDEFVVLASEATSQTQEVLLRRLEESLKQFNAGESRYELSLSVGVAPFDRSAPSPLVN